MAACGTAIGTTSDRRSVWRDPFKDGKTSVRAGYSLTFVNEEGATVK
jgi:hypothetical protein